MPVTYVIDKPTAVGYIQWTGDNLQEFADYFGNVYNVEVLATGNLRVTYLQNSALTREFVQGTWIAGVNNYMSDEQKLSKKQEVPGPSVEYLTAEAP